MNKLERSIIGKRACDLSKGESEFLNEKHIITNGYAFFSHDGNFHSSKGYDGRILSIGNTFDECMTFYKNHYSKEEKAKFKSVIAYSANKGFLFRLGLSAA